MARTITGAFAFDLAGTLTDFSDDVSTYQPNFLREVLDDTAVNDVHRSKTPGIRDGNTVMSGYYVSGTGNISAALDAAVATSVPTTIEMSVDGEYWSAEAYPEGWVPGAVNAQGVVTVDVTWQHIAVAVKSSVSLVA